jgi:hypothetical protein
MLADTLLGEQGDLDAMMFGGLAGYKKRLAAAQKFVIDRSIGEVAGDMPRQAVRDALPFCRLPYPICWLEIAQQDRPFFADAFLHGPNHAGAKTYQPVRVGILCEQQGDNPQRFWATLAWTYSVADQLAQGLDTPVSICPAGASIWCDTFDHQLGEPFLLTMTIAPYCRDMMAVIATKDPALMEQLGRNSNHDWAGEPWFWLAVMALLNAKNGASSTFVPAPAKLNKARRKAGKQPLAEYHQLTLRIGPSERGTGRGGPSGHAAQRAHTVRGHFKIRRTGIYWWRPFIRGDVAGGFSKKTYKVKL